MKNQSSSFTKLVALIFVGFLLALMPSTASSQTNKVTDGSTPLGISSGSPTGSYALSDFESVNLYNGGLNFRLPLVKISGRGGAGYTMTLRIETKWIVEKEYGLGQPNTYTPTTVWWGVDGQQPIYSVGKIEGRQAGSRDFVNIYPCGYVHRETLTRLTFTTPDGTEYELRDQSTNGQPYTVTSSCTGLNRGRIFVTSDGSAATFTSDADISDYVYDNPGDLQPSGYLSLRDGTRYRIDGGLVTWMRDRNGNKITFSYTGRNLTTITDSLNRQVTITYGTPYDQITTKGFGGAARTIKVYKGTALRSDFSIQNYNVLFPELNGAYATPYTPNGVTAVELPNGKQYQFYYNSYGELARVAIPTGGAIEYDYATGLTDGGVGGVITYAGEKHVYRRVIERRVYPDGGSGTAYASRMTYSRPESSTSNAGYVIADQYNSSGGLLNRSNHYFYGSPRASFGQQPTQYPGWKDGREYQGTVFAANGTTPLQQTTSVFAQRAAVSWWTGGADQEPPNDPRLIETTTTLMDTNQVSKQTFGYDDSVPFNNQNNVKEYDFGTGAPGALLRETRTTYLTSPGYTGTSVSLLSLPSQTSVFDGGGIERARAMFEYDNYNTDTYHAGLVYRSNISGLDAAFTTSYATRGNVTATTNYFLTNGSVTGSITSYAQYDVAGNVVKTIDARGYATNVDYSDRFGSPDSEARNNSGATELGGQMSYAFPTLVTNALGQTAYMQFDYYLGRAVDGEDANGIVSSSYFNDALDRPKQVIRGSNQGTGIKSQSTIDYDDTNRVVTTTSDLTTYGDNLLKGQILYDAMGRTTEKRQYESANGYIAVRQTYDVLGRSYQTSNPFRSGDTIVWTTAGYDVLNRVISVTTSDSAVVGTSYSGNTVTVTDQVGKQRKSVTDALGRLIQIYEDPNGLNYLTSYSYDTLDNLITVNQGGQTRTFAYDSLKRLSSSTNPENGTVSYTYDNNSNLLTKTDARNIVTTIGYDALNRPTTKTYSDGTSSIAYFYDSQSLPGGAPTFDRGYAIGRLVATTYGGGSVGTYLGYDQLGRALRSIQQLGGVNYQTTAIYNLAGAITTETYPSGHTTTFGYDNAGRINNYTGNLGDGVTRTYSTGVSYSVFGGMQEEQFGTQTPLYHKQRYNVRGQLWDMRLSTVSYANDPANGDRGAIVNYYGNNFVQGGSNTTNNGNLLRQENYIPGSSYFQDNFDYDSLNRLTSISEKLNGTGADSFKQAYTYDRLGNRTIDQTNTSTNLPLSMRSNFTVNTATNRLNAPVGYSFGYDNAGNQNSDTYGDGFSVSYSRAYDAENRMTSSTATYSNPYQAVTSTYTYDGDGHRIKRNVGGTETWQVYGLGGELIAEYKSGAATFLPTKEYGYRSGQLLVTMSSGDDARLSRFVTNLYYGALQRDPTSTELQNGINTLATAGAQSQSQLLTVAKDLARGLFTQTGYETSPYRSDIQFVADLYYTYLQRGPDDAGLNWWAGQVPTNGRANVAMGFEVSSEFATLVSTLYGTATSDNQRTDQIVNNFYLGARGTNATPTELQTERDALNAAAAQGVAQVQSALDSFGRSLFAAQLNDPNVTNQQFVTNLYEAFLQRGPDGPGLAFWSGGSKQWALDGIASSTAFRDLAATLYRESFWLVADHLGTPRMIVDKSGSLAGVKRHDYQPFGEEIYAGLGGRTTGQGYTGDSVRQHFTSKERDNETGLDYFGARYYASPQGRLTSPDEFTGGPDELYTFVDDASDNPTFYADLKKPQSLNKYQYAYNNPLRWVDPDGHDPEEPEPPQNPKPVIPVPVPVVPGMPPMPMPVPMGPPAKGPTDQQIVDGVKSVLDTVCDYTGITRLADWLRPKIMPGPAPTTAPAQPQTQTTTPPTPIVQPMPPPPPVEARHRKERPSTKDKHQAPRPGRPTTKNRQDPDWRPRQRPKDWPKGKPWPPWKNPEAKD